MGNLVVNTIYPAFMGEVNKFGIGVPCTFVRLQGCNIRCYKKTLGVMCDTPEALEGKGGKIMSPSEIADEVFRLNNKVVCLTGGEPLLQDVTELICKLTDKGFFIVIETNGTRPISPYRCYRNVSFVIDYKSASTGVPSNEMVRENITQMTEDDYLKFVLYDEIDYTEFRDWHYSCSDFCKGNIAVGLFWGSTIGYEELMRNLVTDRIKVHLNMQVHKMAIMYDNYARDSAQDMIIPKDL